MCRYPEHGLEREAKGPGTGARRGDPTWGSGGGAHEGEGSPAPSTQETAQKVTSAEKAGEGTHHSLSQSPKETPAGPPAPALRAPRLRTCAPHPAPRRSGRGRDLPPCPPNTLPLAPGSRHGHCPCHPSCAAASVRTGRPSPQQAWRELAAQGRPAGSPRLPASAPANTPARCSCFTVSRVPLPSAGLSPGIPPPQCLRGADVISSPAVQTDAWTAY